MNDRRKAAEERIKLLCERAILSGGGPELERILGQLRAEISLLTHNLSLEAGDVFLSSRYFVREDRVESL